jgi:hypothetical protein
VKDYPKFIGFLAPVAFTILIFWFFTLPLFTAGKVVDRQTKKFDAETSVVGQRD